MKIGILGGTFNPLHKGHLEVAKIAKDQMNLDEVWMIPTYKSPFKEFEITRNNPKLRYKIVKKTVEDLELDWLKVKNFEQKSRGISYTYKTLEYIKKHFPKYQLFLIVGDDYYHTLKKWKNIDEIENMADIIFVRRTQEVKKQLLEDERYAYVHDVYFPISSSEILQNANWDDIHPKTKPHIAQHYLYIKELVYNRLNTTNKNNLYIHSLSVANHAKKLAKRYKYFNKNKAYYAGLAHDLFKNDDPIKQTKYLLNNSDWTIPPTPAIHGYYSALWFKLEYEINDEEFIQAIKNHTLASGKMSKLDKIIFVADKIADDRRDPISKKYRKLAYNNLDLTFYYLLLENVKKLEARHIEIHPETLEAIKNYRM